jgi:hypothetical protein
MRHSQLVELREKHGSIEPWWETKFGHRFDCLAQSEARYLARTPDADIIPKSPCCGRASVKLPSN